MHEVVDRKACSSTALVVTTVVLELIKAIEIVDLWVAWRWCCFRGFDPGILAVVFSYFTMERRSIVDNCYSDAVRTCTAPLAGSRWFCCILKAVLIVANGQSP